MITVGTTMMMPIQSGTALTPEDQKESGRKVPRATTGDNVYVA